MPRSQKLRKNLSVAVVCLSGIAWKVYPRGVASTVHSFYKLGSADLQDKQLIGKSADNSITEKKYRSTPELFVFTCRKNKWLLSFSSRFSFQFAGCLFFKSGERDLFWYEQKFVK